MTNFSKSVIASSVINTWMAVKLSVSYEEAFSNIIVTASPEKNIDSILVVPKIKKNTDLIFNSCKLFFPYESKLQIEEF